MSLLQRWIEAIWQRGTKDVAIVVGLLLVAVLVLAGLLWLFGVDVAGAVERLVNWNS